MLFKKEVLAIVLLTAILVSSIFMVKNPMLLQKFSHHFHLDHGVDIEEKQAGSGAEESTEHKFGSLHLWGKAFGLIPSLR
ncbi:hypothetical protein V6R21_28325 [Limibacter armeniacum]|uniref:hypothetical protein n=1 Tax=Limibacter armeniacum TaxID=466084 RepID=UPI002FE5B7FD